MVNWREFAQAQPEMARAGQALLEKHGLAYVATVRPDGWPRMHPVAPLIVDGHLLVCTPKTSPKGRDQVRDGRCVIHLLPGRNDDEFLIRARARVVDEASVWAGAKAVAHWVHDGDFLFEYDFRARKQADSDVRLTHGGKPVRGGTGESG